ncbi:MAG: ImmA/IrrE family metallo-endopeptidase [Rhodocyclaceae bacterium]|nr:MAG: ImmA/IrrE family metallo-endopeptidase [Rhodocyclaceae bacterium]
MSQTHSRRGRQEFGAVVPPRSAASIELEASVLREMTETSEQTFFPIVQLYDALHELVPGASYDVLGHGEMGDNHGLTLLTKKEIRIREDVFEAACKDDGFGRFTMCHELGHLLLHEGVGLQRSAGEMPIYMSSEWQADMFAGALLMPETLVDLEASPDELMGIFGVSRSAAHVRLKLLKQRKTKGATKRTW